MAVCTQGRYKHYYMTAYHQCTVLSTGQRHTGNFALTTAHLCKVCVTLLSRMCVVEEWWWTMACKASNNIFLSAPRCIKINLKTLNSRYAGQARASTAHIKKYAIGEMQPAPPTSGLCISPGCKHAMIIVLQSCRNVHLSSCITELYLLSCNSFWTSWNGLHVFDSVR